MPTLHDERRAAQGIAGLRPWLAPSTGAASAAPVAAGRPCTLRQRRPGRDEDSGGDDDDPFYLAPARIRNGKWFGKLWKKLGRKGLHVHGFHYILVSQPEPILLPYEGGGDYQNIDLHDKFLRVAGRDARYLGLIPAGEIVDRRNDEATIPAPIEASDGIVFVSGGATAQNAIGFETPRLVIAPPVIQQRYRIEIWIEKSTMQHLLQPLQEEFGVTVQPMGGDASLTLCEDFVRRAAADGRPTIVLYVSDFDPAGHNMPVAAARKIQFLLHQQGLDLDIRVRPVALTHDQCVRYRLPRTPLKETERRAAKFEERFGEGGTELDALEALRPGMLRNILVNEILRNYDDNLDANIEQVAGEAQAQLDAINERITAAHRDDLSEVTTELTKLQRAIAAFDKKASNVTDKISHALNEEAPDADEFDWPEPADGDDDDDPLFDSARDFIEQTDKFKAYQGKDIERAERQLGAYDCTCITCGKHFTAVRRTAKYCNAPCRTPRDPNSSHKKTGKRHGADG